MPPGRVAERAVRAALRRNGIDPKFAGHRGRRQGVFVRQRSDTMVRVTVDVDSPVDRDALAKDIPEILAAAGYRLKASGSEDIPAWSVTRPAEES